MSVDENSSRTNTDMTVGSESHMGATNINSEVLNTIQTKMKWPHNVIKLTQVTAEMRCYNPHVFCINERR
jgi:hypothetical protein